VSFFLHEEEASHCCMVEGNRAGTVHRFGCAFVLLCSPFAGLGYADGRRLFVKIRPAQRETISPWRDNPRSRRLVLRFVDVLHRIVLDQALKSLRLLGIIIHLRRIRRGIIPEGVIYFILQQSGYISSRMTCFAAHRRGARWTFFMKTPLYAYIPLTADPLRKQ